MEPARETTPGSDWEGVSPSRGLGDRNSWPNGKGVIASVDGVSVEGLRNQVHAGGLVARQCVPTLAVIPTIVIRSSTDWINGTIVHENIIMETQ